VANRKYKNNEPRMEPVAGYMWHMPFENEQGWEDSNIGIELEPSNGLIWFYQIDGLREGINWQEAEALAKQLLEIAKQAKRLTKGENRQ
jgi:hypothetical protein